FHRMLTTIVGNQLLTQVHYLLRDVLKETMKRITVKVGRENGLLYHRRIIEAIEAEGLLSGFRGRTASDLYLYLVKHWDELKRRYGLHYPVSAAARDFRDRYGRGFLKDAKAFLGSLFKKR
ncbi:MAG TPA: hypothetical protein PLQ29_01370, partial [Spirochaetales bacterium]|nr:hypothetical protein [Spirochaetales bacterium]